MSTFTPGPWVVNAGDHAHISNPLYRGVIATVECSPDRFLAVCKPNNVGVEPEAYLPNARLMAAAPELLTALEGAETYLRIIALAEDSDDPWVIDLYAAICAAITKAGGRVGPTL